ncbi:energy transducer TonB [Thalassotalea sp. HSM 43]|uniref:energy transducer TonB n=1 Tax=Thalassotalea sp. HSM 43 TaxID=2552945 RepID=UPI0010809838|nr:energy transducer TonB [Thalassotalea sp. HSM 43]QBY03078.1 energy transducer TonB [Thalassotalea sp. HSM 43]
MKFFVPIILGAFISFALFAIMASLVATEEVYIEEVEDNPIITIVKLPEDSAIARKKRILDPPPEPLQKPSGLIGVDMPKVTTETKLPNVSMPQIEVDGSLESQEFAVGAIKDNDARPIYRALPRYPIEAAREQIRGWVKLKFAVNRYGKIENIEVLDASPPEIFDQAAIDALKRWKYQAKVIDGKTVRQEGMSVRIDFGKK